MSMQPRLESRVLAQEQMQVTINAFVVELAEDMTTAFQRVQDDQIQNNRKIDALSQGLTTASFEQLISYQKQTECQIDERFGKIEADIAEIKATMATKEDLAAIKGDMQALEGRMQVMEWRMDRRVLESLKQVLAMLSTRQPLAQ